MENSAAMIDQLNRDLARENDDIAETEQSADHLAEVLDELLEEMKVTKRQRIREIMKKPEKEAEIEATYDELEEELQKKIDGLNHQIDLLSDKRNTVIKVNRAAKTALEVFADILAKEKLDRNDLELIIDRVLVFEDHLEIKLQRDIDSILRYGTLEEAANFNSGIENSLHCRLVQSADKRPDKVFDVNVISDGDPLEIFTDREGEVILKKYSPIGELGDFAKEYAESLQLAFGTTAAVCDKDNVIAACGACRKELIDKAVSQDIDDLMTKRTKVCLCAGEGRIPQITADETAQFSAAAVAPIISAGDPIGAVMLLSRDEDATMGKAELKAVETAAHFLGKQMED